MNSSLYLSPRTVTDLGKFTYTGLPFVVFFVGIPGHLVVLRSFYLTSKKEGGYAYQFCLTAHKILEITILCFYYLMADLSSWSTAGGGNDAVAWFRRSYSLQFLTAHLCIPACMIVVNASSLITLALAMDRVFAISRPLGYKAADHRKIRRITLIFSTILAVFLNIWDGWISDVESVEVLNPATNLTEQYYVVHYARGGFYYSPFVTIIGHTRSVVRVLATLVLIISNTYLAVALRKRTRKLNEMTLGGSTEKEHLRRRAATERRLLILTVCQSVSMLIHETPPIVYPVIMLAAPGFALANSRIIDPSMDATIQLASLIDLVILTAADKKVRSSFANIFATWKKALLKVIRPKGVQVTPIINVHALNKQ